MSTTDTQPPAIMEDASQTGVTPEPLTWRERGMVTAEYVVGIVAAIALALVLLKIFKADSFFTWIFDIVKSVFGAITGLFS